MPLTCDLLLANATILTMDENFTIYAPGAIAITGDRIAAVGTDLAADFTADQIIYCGGRIIMPGLINAHTHAAMNLIRGLADDLRLDVWLLGYIMPVERHFVTPEFVRLGTRLACAEMIRSGVTCFADMYYHESAVAEAAAAAGLRAICGQTVLKFPTPDAATYEDALVLARDFLQRWQDHPLITPAVAPHAPYTCTPDILLACVELAREFNVPVLTHISETRQEIDDLRQATGMPPVPWIKKHRLLETKLIAAHGVHLDEGEMRALQRAGAGLAHCPASNLKLASGIAPVAKMLALGLNVGLGTDSAASNNDLDMFEEIRLAALLAKGVSGDPTAMPARQALALATSLGAQAVHLADITGSLKPGKRADLIVLDIETTHTSPGFDHDPGGVYGRVVYAAKSTDVTDVMCNGRWLMRDCRLLTIDEAEDLQAARECAARIDAFLKQREESVLQKLIAIGGAMEQESFEVQAKARLLSAAPVELALQNEAITVIRSRRYHQYDTYFLFADPREGRLRYREDEFLDEAGRVTGVRARLTLAGHAPQDRLGATVLSRSRYLAPARHSLRFYREYFRPRAERTVEKERRRWLIVYRGVEFFVNLDRLIKPPAAGCYLEIKSRTWSRRDAQDKAAVINELLALFGVTGDNLVMEDYPETDAEPTRQCPPRG